jgi:hypothetical protein
MDTFRLLKGTSIIDADELEGAASMYRAPDPDRLLRAILPELSRRVADADSGPVEIGLTVDDRRFLLHVEGAKTRSKVEPDRLGRRHLTLSAGAFVRLVMGHDDPDALLNEDGSTASTATALDSARILFPRRPIWRSPLDSASA